MTPSRDLPNPGIEPASLMSPILAEGFLTTSTTTLTFWVTVNNMTALSFHVQVFMCLLLSISLLSILRSGIAGLCGRSMFNILR